MGPITNIYHKRLLLFARRLDRIQQIKEHDIREAWIIWDDSHPYLVTFDMNHFFELPVVFDEWNYYKPADEVEVKTYPKHLGMSGMIMRFFWLSPEEFCDIFCTTIDPKEIAFNIRKHVRKKYGTKNKYGWFT